MAIQQTERIFEEQRLKEILGKIEAKITEGQQFFNDFRQRVRQTNKQMWEDLTLTWNSWEDLDILIRANQFLYQYKREIITYDFYKALVRRLQKMVINPYFGRIDFREDGRTGIEQVYIGIYTLIDDTTQECLIYDWRASISSMFYDYEPGRAEYFCLEGKIEGEMLMKRQYKIADGEIKFMFDTNLKIDDEILQTLLSQNTTGKMKNIVTTIQREQNRIIRDESHKLLIVQGAAGSGKTSIALHRVAYLLYKYRNTINSDNILIFSPNLIFSDYISNVLPELGEDNMSQMTFHQYAVKTLERRFQSKVQIEDVTDQLEYFYSGTQDDPAYCTRVAGTRYKASPEFVQVIKNYIQYLNEEGVSFADVTYDGEPITTKEELQELWQRYNYLPLEKRLYKIRQKILRKVNTLKKQRIKEFRASLGVRKDSSWDIALKEYMLNLRENLHPLKQHLRQMLSYDELELYLELFVNEPLFSRMAAKGESHPHGTEQWKEICSQTVETIRAGVLPYEDVAPVLYLKRALQGAYPYAANIKHVLIDEAQDYSLFHYEIVHQLFPNCYLTVLGDLNQSIHPFMGIGDYRKIAEVFMEDAEMVQLTKSYRSTREISAFAQAVLGTADKVSGLQNAIDRPGERPQISKITDDDTKETLLSGIESLKQKGAQSIAVICKTAAESEKIFNLLESGTRVNLMTVEDQEFQRQTVVIPAYLAKGLEFDAVLLYLNESYSEDEVYLLYTICTRALHYLQIYHTGEFPQLNRIDGELYQEVAFVK